MSKVYKGFYKIVFTDDEKLVLQAFLDNYECISPVYAVKTISKSDISRTIKSLVDKRIVIQGKPLTLTRLGKSLVDTYKETNEWA